MCIRDRYNGRLDTVESVMRRDPFTVSVDWGIAQSIAIMEQRKVTTLLVVDEAGRFLGSVGVEEIMKHAKKGLTLSDLELKPLPTVRPDSPAVDAFEQLTGQRLDVLVVADQDDKVVGVVTKTSMVKSLAHAVWEGVANG